MDLELAKDPVQVLFDRALGQMKFVSDLLIGLAEPDQADNLSFPRGEFLTGDAFSPGLWLPARGTNSLLRMRSKFCAASEASLGLCDYRDLASHIPELLRFA